MDGDSEIWTWTPTTPHELDIFVRGTSGTAENPHHRAIVQFHFHIEFTHINPSPDGEVR